MSLLNLLLLAIMAIVNVCGIYGNRLGATFVGHTATVSPLAPVIPVGECVIPAVIQPRIQAEYPAALPLIILEDNDDDRYLHHLLTYLLLTKNRRNNAYENHSNGKGCTCGDAGLDANCECGRNKLSDNFIPYPFPIPYNSHFPFAPPVVEEEAVVLPPNHHQSGEVHPPNEISVIIRAE